MWNLWRLEELEIKNYQWNGTNLEKKISDKQTIINFLIIWSYLELYSTIKFIWWD